jgi:hypothetical protein
MKTREAALDAARCTSRAEGTRFKHLRGQALLRQLHDGQGHVLFGTKFPKDGRPNRGLLRSTAISWHIFRAVGGWWNTLVADKGACAFGYSCRKDKVVAAGDPGGAVK